MKKGGEKHLLKNLILVLAVSLFAWVAPSQGLAQSQCPTITTTGGGTFTYPATITLGATILDTVGGAWSYAWSEGTAQHCASTQPLAITANTPFLLPPCSIDSLAPGTHTFVLNLENGASTCSATVTAIIVDNVAPTLAPTVHPSILWPPNNKLVPVVVTPNASDNTGVAPTVTATVVSSEPVKIVGKMKQPKKPKKPTPVTTSWDTPIYNADGTITFMLPAQRLGTGTGRIYTITLTATDASGNSSSASVEVKVPHDQHKKQ